MKYCILEYEGGDVDVVGPFDEEIDAFIYRENNEPKWARGKRFIRVMNPPAEKKS